MYPDQTMVPVLTAAAVLLVLTVNCLSRAHPDHVFSSDNLQDDPSLSFNRERRVQEASEGDDTDCTSLTWFTEGKNNSCECGAKVHGAVSCNSFTKHVAVLDCYCMTNESYSHQMVVGQCIFNCVNMSKREQYLDFVYHSAPSRCDYLHRRGTLCGRCDHENHYYSPAYSYDLHCVKCTQPQSWWLYIAVAFLPLTAFIVMILVFRISAVSPELHAFICFTQVTGAPFQIRIILLSTKYTQHMFALFTRIFASLYGVWNLDFFRTLIPGVCLHLSSMQVLALDYLVAVYPMFLMVTVYILTELHARGFRPFLFLWKPFHHILARFRREWEIKTSLIDAFVTFFILSSTKLFCASLDLLIPTTLYMVTGDELGTYLYYDPTIKYMSHNSGHLYYGLLALAVLLVFAIFPASLLLFSTCKCLRGPSRIPVVREFLHTFQRFYKDGTGGTKDCRWYAAYHHISVFGIFLIYAVLKTEITYVVGPVYFIAVAIIVLIAEPYKDEFALYNVVDCVLYLWQAMLCVTVTTLNLSSYLQRQYIVLGYILIFAMTITPLVFPAAMVFHWLLKVLGFTKCRKNELRDDASLAHRITHTQEYKDSCGYVTLHTQESFESAEDTDSSH